METSKYRLSYQCYCRNAIPKVTCKAVQIALKRLIKPLECSEIYAVSASLHWNW